ncbi:SDR family NAD(P)-dependent oxidoreductase [Shimazuella alba]|uniref:SDR family NAD(P)-dependent oxidoreductase n=1 Tax=Shimazuella alba TaxID=2690964 RepID=UPI001F3A326E|nr:SDR family NAD(P)-dependent oxidoreductase [Shimazuella alba]
MNRSFLVGSFSIIWLRYPSVAGCWFYDTNLTGYFLVSRGFAPLMVQQGQGHIINISVNYETMKRRGFIPYGPSRAATGSLSIIMAEDLKPYGITVDQLLPGSITETGMIPDQEEIRAEITRNR